MAEPIQPTVGLMYDLDIYGPSMCIGVVWCESQGRPLVEWQHDSGEGTKEEWDTLENWCKLNPRQFPQQSEVPR